MASHKGEISGPDEPGRNAQGGAPAEPSFDPRTWAQGPSSPQKSAAEAPPPQPTSRRGLIFGAVAVACVGGGVALAWTLSRPHPRQRAETAGLQQEVLTVDGLGSVAAALTGQGISAGDSQAAATVVGSAMKGDQGELRLRMALARQAGRVELAELEIRRPDGSGVMVRPHEGQFAATPIASALRSQLRAVHGQMDSQSFYSSAVSAGLNDALIPDFFQAFVYDFDFQREIEPGDVFEAALEETVNDQGQAVGPRRLVYASMTTKAKSRALYAFISPGSAASEWFDGAGRNIRRSLMRTPVEGARISSTFGMRFHPVLGFTRMHKGTDFATPVGTPVYASGDGAIDFIGEHDGHGNYIRIRHSPSLETAYAHLSKFGDGLVVGSPVHQGQQIALSGNTGLSSGPHVHYEVIVNGEQVDSQTFQTEEGHALAGSALKAFIEERDRIDKLRAVSL